MIKFTDNKNDIILCWQEAFHDSDEDILFFIDNVRNGKCLAYYDNDQIQSMLYLVESSLGKYVYAACTLQKYQAKGLMTKLLDFCKAEYDRVCLIPANAGLIDYYKKRGLNIVNEIDMLNFDESEEINEYLFEGCELEHPIVLSYERKN